MVPAQHEMDAGCPRAGQVVPFKDKGRGVQQGSGQRSGSPGMRCAVGLVPYLYGTQCRCLPLCFIAAQLTVGQGLMGHGGQQVHLAGLWGHFPNR